MLRYYINQIRSTNLNLFYDLLKNNSYLILILAIYLIAGIILLPHYQYVINADGFSYVTIAQKYVHGDFNNAINGLWSPLISWLLSLLLIFNSSPEYAVYAFKILSLIIGLFPIIGIYLLSFRFEINELIRKLILVFSIPMILFISLVKTTPDLLSLNFIIYYLYIIFNPKYSNKLLNGILCGILGALGYFSKNYIFVFFPIHFILINLYNYYKIRKNKTKILKSMFIGLTIFFILSSIWIGAISNKYGYITIGTASTYNQELMGPNCTGHPMFYQGLFKPPNKTALSAWEDPTNHKMEPWSPFSSWNLFKYQLRLILDHFIDLLVILNVFSVFSIIIILSYLLYLVKKPRTIKNMDVPIYSLFTIFIYSFGYLPLHFEPRYIFINYILIFLLGGQLLTTLYNKYPKREFLINFLTILLMCSFITSPLTCLNENFNQNEDLYYLSQTLKSDYNIKGNIASTGGIPPIAWERSHFMSYYLDSKYYGGANESNIEDLIKDLKENNIDYYFAWSHNESNNIQLPLKEVFYGRIAYRKNIVYLKIYSLN